jgi:acetyl-CoA carboxylase biotin carboxyl carrier protein
MNKKKIDELIAILKDNDLSEVTIEEGGTKITVRRGEITIVEGGGAAPAVTSHIGGPAAKIAAEQAGTPEMAELESKYSALVSPMVGSFYRAPAPGGENFIEEGDTFDAGQTLCVVEAMKLMNDIVADEAGRVIKVVAADGAAVEFGQTLLFFEPLG